jgi:ankyrin repeat protein
VQASRALVFFKLLLSYEACDVNIIDCDNCNALHYACKNGQADIVELLLFTKTTTQINVNIEFNKNVHNVFITFLQATCKGVDP